MTVDDGICYSTKENDMLIGYAVIDGGRTKILTLWILNFKIMISSTY